MDLPCLMSQNKYILSFLSTGKVWSLSKEFKFRPQPCINKDEIKMTIVLNFVYYILMWQIGWISLVFCMVLNVIYKHQSVSKVYIFYQLCDPIFQNKFGIFFFQKSKFAYSFFPPKHFKNGNNGVLKKLRNV